MYPTTKNSPYSGEQLGTSPRKLQRHEAKWRKSKTEEDRRIVIELLNEERDLDYYLDSESESDYGYQFYV